MVSLSFYRCTPPCGGVPGPDLEFVVSFLLLWRAFVSWSLSSLFHSNKVGDLVLAPSVVRVWVYYPCNS
ncbi:unnamed protein product, partial [Brassica oleracea]